SIWAHNAEYAIVSHPEKAGEFALVERLPDGQFRWVTEPGKTDVRAFVSEDAAREAIRSSQATVLPAPPPTLPALPTAPTVGGSFSKVVNSDMTHAIDQAVLRNVYPTRADARNALQALGKQINKGGFPKGTLADPQRLDSLLVPLPNGQGYAIYELKKNGT